MQDELNRILQQLVIGNELIAYSVMVATVLAFLGLVLTAVAIYRDTCSTAPR